MLHNPKTMTVTPSESLESGQLVAIGDVVGVTISAIEAGKLGTVRIAGVFDAPKAALAGEMAQGSRVYLTAAGEITDDDSQTYAGIAVENTSADATRVQVRLWTT